MPDVHIDNLRQQISLGNMEVLSATPADQDQPIRNNGVPITTLDDESCARNAVVSATAKWLPWSV
jgi:hypothetical protein